MVDEHLARSQVDDLDEDQQAPLLRRAFAEFTGTLLFVAVGTGAATVLALGPLRRLAGITEIIGPDPNGQQVYGALLATGAPTLSEILPVAFAFATGLAVLVYALGGVSGAHFNPAVSFALAVARRFSWKELPVYWIAQVLGGIGGAFVVAGIYGQTGASSSNVDILFGATTVADNVDQWQAILSEAFIAFLLMTAIMAVAVDPRAPKGWSGLIIGLSLAGGIIVTAEATGGSANFARSLGPLVASLVYDVGNIPWGDLIVYAAGPLIGAAAAALVYESLTGLEKLTPAPLPGVAGGEEAASTEAASTQGDHYHHHVHDDEAHAHEHDHTGEHRHEH